MDPKLQKFIKNLRQIHLTVDEKFSLRQKLFEVMQTKDFTPSPYIAKSLVGISIWHWFKYSRQFQITAAFLLIFSLSGSTIAWASQRSLPGDLLYPLKISVSENVLRTISKTSPVTEVNFETAMMEERLVEAERLDQEQRLTEPLKMVVSRGITSQEARVNNAVTNLINKNNESFRNGDNNNKSDNNISEANAVASSSNSVGQTNASVMKKKSFSGNRNKNSVVNQKQIQSGEDTINTDANINGNGSLEAGNQATSTTIDTEAEDKITHVNDVLKNHQTIIEKMQLHDSKVWDYGERDNNRQDDGDGEN